MRKERSVIATIIKVVAIIALIGGVLYVFKDSIEDFIIMIKEKFSNEEDDFYDDFDDDFDTTVTKNSNREYVDITPSDDSEESTDEEPADEAEEPADEAEESAEETEE